jgi:hypothetical protein
MEEEENGLMKTDLFPKKRLLFPEKFDLAESFKPDAKIRVYVSDIKDYVVSRRRFQIRLIDVRSPPE